MNDRDSGRMIEIEVELEMILKE